MKPIDGDEVDLSPAPQVEIRSPQTFLARLREELGGSVTIPTGVDLTAPTGESWDAEAAPGEANK